MMESLARPLFIIVGLIVGYGFIWVISRLLKGRFVVDLFAAVNMFLYLGLLFNIYIAMTEDSFVLITAAVIVFILLFRRIKVGRWI